MEYCSISPVFTTIQNLFPLSISTIMSNNGGAVGIGSEGDVVAEMTIKGIEKDDSGPSTPDPGVNVEKGEMRETEAEEEEEEYDQLSHEYPFPVVPGEELETQQFTFRAVFVGCLLGAVISASKYVALIPWSSLSLLNCNQHLSRSEDWLDIRSLPFRFYLRLCHPETPFEDTPH